MRPANNLPFPIEEYQRRIGGLRRGMEQRGIDVMMVNVPENICYLSGFETTGYASYQALFVPLSAEPFMITRLLEDTGVQAFTWIEVSRPFTDDVDPLLHTRAVLREFGLHDKRIGYERSSSFLTAPQQERLLALCTEATWIDASGVIEELRLIKSDLELEKIRQAARFAEAATRAGVEAAAAGVSDNDVAAAMHHAMLEAGGHYPAVVPFVATGPRSAVGHATWGGRILQPGDCLFFESAGCRHRYHAAIMRTGWIGEPDATAREAERIISEAVEATLERIRPGVAASELDAVSRRIIAGNTVGLEQRSRSAYSIGIAFAPDWGEGHMFSWHPAETRVLAPNMVFHLIPWGLVPGRFAMGLSETIRVTETGVEVITDLPREVFVK